MLHNYIKLIVKYFFEDVLAKDCNVLDVNYLSKQTTIIT